MTFSDWYERCCLAVRGQDSLFQQIICNYFEKNSQTPGIHSIRLEGITGSGKSTIGRALVENCPFEAKFVDCVSLFMNSRIGGPESELAALFRSDQPRLLVLDHAECLLHAAQVDAETEQAEQPVITLSSPSIERKMYLIFRDALDRHQPVPLFLIVILDGTVKMPDEIARPYRLSRHLTVSIASKMQRKALLEHFLSALPFANATERAECIDILCGQPTSGFTVADLEGFIRRVIERKSSQCSKLEDFLLVRGTITPTSITGRATLKPKTAPFMVALERQQTQINDALSSIFTGQQAPRGILLHGPSGCGKSLLASTLASFSLSPQHRLPITFIAVDSASLLSKYFGQSERNLAQVFADARSASPCIVFFDQIDALAAKRSTDSDSSASDRLLTTFLVEMDGFARKRGNPDEDTVIVLATTSNPKLLDPAMLRPGRLDLHVELPLPGTSERLLYMRAFLSQNQGFRLSEAEVARLVEETENFTFADLESLFREAALTALRQDINCEFVEFHHFNE